MNGYKLSTENVNITSAFLETTSICNLRCKHCYNESGTGNVNLSAESIEKIIAGLIPFGAKRFSISGGEPLLHPALGEILHLLTKYPVHFQIISNGTLINDAISLLRQYTGKLSLQISLDGLQEAHDYLRGNGSFAKTKDSIKILKSSDIPFYFKTTINKRNCKDLEEIVKLAVLWGGTSISFSFLNPIGRGLINTDLHMSDSEILESFHLLESLKLKYADQIPIEIPHLYRNSICPWFSYNMGKMLKISPRVDVYGNVFMCNAFMNPKFSIGNINEDDIENIILGQKTIQLLDFLKLLKNYITCPTCVLNSECNRGCPVSFIEKINGYDDNFCSSRRKSFITYICKNEHIDMQ